VTVTNIGAREILSDWPGGIPRNWLQTVNRPQSLAEVDAVRLAVRRGRPFGSLAWTTRTTQRLGLETTLRPADAPGKPPITNNENYL
jgi:putative transposase